MTMYNGEKYLLAQLHSVLGQLRSDDELIVIDDVSSDASISMVRAIADPRVKLHCNPVNLGVRQSFELGLRQAAHEVVFLCDQDDVWLPGKRDAFVAAFEQQHETLIVVSDVEVIDGSGQMKIASFMATKGGFRGSVWNTLVRNRYLGCAMALRRPLLEAVLPIPAGVPMHDMWIGALGSMFGHVHYLPKPYLQYRRHGGNVSPSSRQGVIQMARWRASLGVLLVSRWLSVGSLKRSASRLQR